MKPRFMTQKIMNYLFREEIIVFTGPRQVGKTTVLKEIEVYLKGKSIPVIYFTLEDIEYLTELNKSPKNIFKLFFIKKRTFLLIDEIQYLDNPTNFLKFLYDEYKDLIKLIVTGSSAFYIDEKFHDSLAGRKRIFFFFSLSFKEFLFFKEYEELSFLLPNKFDIKESKNITLHTSAKNKIEELLTEFICYGGYPRIVLTNNPDEKIELIREIATSYVKKDMFESNVRYNDKFFKLLKILSSSIGQLINANELANTLNISKKAIDNYLYIMQKSYHVGFIRPFYNNLRKELIKMPKAYFYDLGLRNYFAGNFESILTRNDKGQLLENNVFLQLVQKVGIDSINYWRTIYKHEVDFIVEEKVALEVKFSSKTLKMSKYNKFINEYNEIPLEIITYQKEKNHLPIYLI